MTHNDDNTFIIEPTVDCDFSNTGLWETTHDMIEKVKWNLGGLDRSAYESATANTWYNSERGTATYGGQPTTWNGKVALMYPSDYGYATSGGEITRQACLSTALYSWSSNSECYNNDWLFDKNSLNAAEWTLTPNANSFESVFLIYFRERDRGNVDAGTAWNELVVRPSLYLSSNVNLVGGVGTKTNPYLIKMK